MWKRSWYGRLLYSRWLEIDGINAVYFSVNGENLKDGDRRAVGLMNEDDFVENTAFFPQFLSDRDTGRCILQMRAGDKLVEQSMDVRYSSNISKEKLIVEKLMQGPTERRCISGYQSRRKSSECDN